MQHMEHIVQMIKDCFGNIMIFCTIIGMEKIMDGHLQKISQRFAQDIGLDIEKWKECMKEAKITTTIFK